MDPERIIDQLHRRDHAAKMAPTNRQFKQLSDPEWAPSGNMRGDMRMWQGRRYTYVDWMLANACVYGDYDVDWCESLIERDASVNAVDKNGQCLLIHAAYGDNPEMLRILLKHGATLENLKTTDLVFAGAIFQPTTACLQVLLDSGQDIDSLDFSGSRPLLHAVQQLQYEHARLLVERGASMVVTSDGRTALEIYRVEPSITHEPQWLALLSASTGAGD